tara:strand:- start:138 stop:446 length:309 start_codon:yes stop_codon:yes gene_type:complete
LQKKVYYLSKVKPALEDLINVFEENICNPDVDFHKCLNNFTDILIEIQNKDLKNGQREQKKKLMQLIIWGNQMLQMKYLDPKNTGVSMALWMKDYTRTFPLK